MIETTEDAEGVRWEKTYSSTRPNAHDIVVKAMTISEREGLTYYAVIEDTAQKYKVILGRIV